MELLLEVTTEAHHVKVAYANDAYITNAIVMALTLLASRSAEALMLTLTFLS